MRKLKGVTLIELIVSVSIIVVLSTMIVPKVSKYVDDAKIAKKSADFNAMTKTMDAAFVDFIGTGAGDKLVGDTNGNASVYYFGYSSYGSSDLLILPIDKAIDKEFYKSLSNIQQEAYAQLSRAVIDNLPADKSLVSVSPSELYKQVKRGVLDKKDLSVKMGDDEYSIVFAYAKNMITNKFWYSYSIMDSDGYFLKYDNNGQRIVINDELVYANVAGNSLINLFKVADSNSDDSNGLLTSNDKNVFSLDLTSTLN